MSGSEPDFDPLDALLQPRKVIWVMPPELRHRVLARAQSAVVASAGIPRVVPAPRPAAAPATVTRLTQSLRPDRRSAPGRRGVQRPVSSQRPPAAAGTARRSPEVMGTSAPALPADLILS